MTDNEKKLFEAITNGDEAEIIKIVREEKENLAKGLPKTIDPAAVNSNRDGFAHLAAKWCSETAIEQLIIQLRTDLTLKDKSGKLPIDCAWHYRFTEAVERRKKLELFENKVAANAAAEAKTQAYTRGLVDTHNFSLFYRAKPNKPHKQCVIPDSNSETGLSVHDEQAITEAFVTQNTTQFTATTNKQLIGFPVALPSTNFLLANIGCVITTIAHQKNGAHERVFITVPIVWNKDLKHLFKQPKPHSEVFFVECILENQENFKQVIKELLIKHKVNFDTATKKFEGRKIYSLVIDLHSSQDMCDSCANKIFDFQNQNTHLVKNTLQELGLHVPKNDGRFKLIFRVSSKRPPSHSDYRKPFISRDEKQEFARVHTHETPMDISRSATAVVLHNDVTMRDTFVRWTVPARYRSLPLLATIPERSVFVNQTGFFRNEPEKYVMPVDDFKKEMQTVMRDFDENLIDESISFLVPTAKI